MALGDAIITHPNGKPIRQGLKRPKRNDEAFYADVYPDNYLGRLLKGILIEYLAKQEPRIGWARKSACDDAVLAPHPCESVAAHQWGVSMLIVTLSREAKFQEEIPEFDRLKAIEMAIIHDVAEVETGDITPVDGISPEEKHRLEQAAMNKILGTFPQDVGHSLHQIYNTYEERQCIESKFVKDCDKLDFIFTAFLLERQGFTGFSEFYPNSTKNGFHTAIAADLAQLLIKTREELFSKNLLYVKSG